MAFFSKKTPPPVIDPLEHAHARTAGALDLFRATVDHLEAANETFTAVVDDSQDQINHHLARKEEASAAHQANSVVVNNIRALLG